MYELAYERGCPWPRDERPISSTYVSMYFTAALLTELAVAADFEVSAAIGFMEVESE